MLWFKRHDFNVSLVVQMPVDEKTNEASSPCNGKGCGKRISVFEKLHGVCERVCVCVCVAGTCVPAVVVKLEVRNVEQRFPRKDSVRQLSLGLRQQTQVERVDFLTRFLGGVDAALNPLTVADEFELLRVERGTRFMKRVQHGLWCFRLGHSVFR